MTEENEISERFAKIGSELIKTEGELFYIKGSSAKIMYVTSNKPKKSAGKVIFASCEKVAPKNKFLINADFIIRIYLPNCLDAGFSDEQYKILLFHELLHIGVKINDKTEEEKYFIRPHDFEEFDCIIKKFGLGWADSQLEMNFGEFE